MAEVICIQTKTVRIAVNIENPFFIAVSALKSSFVSSIKNENPLYKTIFFHNQNK
nr:hypothetical protein [uncultured Prevotella sp.]